MKISIPPPPLLQYVVLLFLVFLTAKTCLAVYKGDELYSDYHGGNFWVFHSSGVSIVNPDTCRIQHEIRRDSAGTGTRPAGQQQQQQQYLLLPEKWADGVYMEYAPNGGPVRAASTDAKTVKGYILINSGVTTYDNENQPQGEVLVFSRESQQVVARIPLEGGRHHRSYGVYTRNEFWTQTHGKLFVLPLEQLEPQQGDGGKAIELMEDHLGIPQNEDITDSSEIQGSILWDEDVGMGRLAYVSSHNPVLHIINLQRKSQFAVFNYSRYLDDDECLRGAHGMAYTKKRLFLECGWDGPILEFDLEFAPALPRFLGKHTNMGGHLREHYEGVILVTDRGQNKVHLLQVQDKNLSSLEYTMEVPGHPDEPSILRSTIGGMATTTVCMPLTENMNQNNRYPNGTVACDAYNSCGPPMNVQDVAAGMCLYDPNNDNKTLLRAPLDDYMKVMNGEAPYLDRCPRCKERDSYRGGDICTCTPHCGSCASPNYNNGELLQQTGVRCFHLEDLESGSPQRQITRLIPGAGAVQQEPPQFWQPPCANGWTHRSSKRGGQYMASIAHIPSNSLQIVDLPTERLVCQVDLPGKPDRVLYVPPRAASKHHSSKSSDDLKRGGAITLGLVLGCGIVAVLITTVLYQRRYGRGGKDDGAFPSSKDQHAAGANQFQVSPPPVEPLSEIS